MTVPGRVGAISEEKTANPELRMLLLVDLLLGLPPGLLRPMPEETYGPNEHPGAFLYKEGSLHDFAFELSEEALDGLGRNEPDVHATLVYRGVRREVGFSLKGSSTYQDLDGKPSIKVDTNEWGGDRDLFGVRRLTLNSMVFDPTRMREHVAYRLYRAMGVPAPRHGYARVTINGEPYGLYGIVETLDERWLRRLFPGASDGNLYDSRFTWADLTGLGVGNFQLEEGDPATAYAELDALVQALDRGDVLDVLDTRFDREATLAMWAVDLAIANWDGYSRNTNNFLLYHATEAGRWHFVPWGQDTAFRGGGSLFAGVRGRMVTQCLGEGACRETLVAKVVEVLDVWEREDLLGYAQATWVAIAAACEADPRDGSCDPDSLLDALEDRPASLRRELGL